MFHFFVRAGSMRVFRNSFFGVRKVFEKLGGYEKFSKNLRGYEKFRNFFLEEEKFWDYLKNPHTPCPVKQWKTPNHESYIWTVCFANNWLLQPKTTLFQALWNYSIFAHINFFARPAPVWFKIPLNLLKHSLETSVFWLKWPVTRIKKDVYM